MFSEINSSNQCHLFQIPPIKTLEFFFPLMLRTTFSMKSLVNNKIENSGSERLK